MKSLRVAPLVLLFVLAARAQLVVGDVGAVGGGIAQFAVVHADGSSTAYAQTGIPVIPFSLLHDPSQPNTFLIGGLGFIGRVTVTGPATATYTPIAAPVSGSGIADMSWQGPQVIATDSVNDQIIRLDPASGAITPVTSGPQAWGAFLFGSCFDPNTGDVYGGAMSSIWRVPAGSTTAVLAATGLADTVYDLVFDPIGNTPVAALFQTNRLVRLLPNGSVVDLIVGPPPGVRSVDVDHNGDFLIGGNSSTVFRVPNSGGVAVPIGVAVGVPPVLVSVAAVKAPFALAAAPFGSGGLTISITGVPPGTLTGLTVGSFDVSLPVGTGPIFGFSPDAFSVRQLVMFPSASSGNPNHWTWPVAAPFFPAAPVFVSPGTLPSGTVLDLIGIGINVYPSFTPTPAVRITIN